jgi:hypothetical protein
MVDLLNSVRIVNEGVRISGNNAQGRRLLNMLEAFENKSTNDKIKILVAATNIAATLQSLEDVAIGDMATKSCNSLRKV